MVYPIEHINDEYVIEAKYHMPLAMDGKLDWGFQDKIKSLADDPNRGFPFESEEDFQIMKESDHQTEFFDAETVRRKELLKYSGTC